MSLLGRTLAPVLRQTITWGVRCDPSRVCKPKTQKFPLAQIQPCHDRIPVDHLPSAVEGVVLMQMDGRETSPATAV
ncbi:hypothetical protein H6F76_15645 [Leptolyngbya sp. FACHB-321]|uniref:hypothetical protein n=1 Tax=Leptolyngbya sp. FACHB-321 TaxID=2692807 RepID=UPI0016848966|nr:hypothetical protein [Leptolyngbya sp. FACHB-321]MBD2036446.1 hypothetical protein [Leptolyngbya sp. FACHB-321]